MKNRITTSLFSVLVAAGGATACKSSPATPDAPLPPPDGIPAPHSCADVLAANPSATDGAQTLYDHTNLPYQAWCDMTDQGGGWTLVLKADGQKTTFAYDADWWTNDSTYQDSAVDNSQVEAKFHAFSEVPLQNVLLVTSSPVPPPPPPPPVGSDAVPVAPASPVGLVLTGMSTPTMLALTRGSTVDLGGSTQPQDFLQLSEGAKIQIDSDGEYVCSQRGINVHGTSNSAGLARVRIGMIGNEPEPGEQPGSCASPDSWVGVGGGLTVSANGCYSGTPTLVPPSVGSMGGGTCFDGTADKLVGPNTTTFAWVYVR